MKTIKYFSAEWCGPCKSFKPIMKELQSEGLNIQFLDIEEHPEEAKSFNVMSVPTCVILEGGTTSDRWTGILSKNQVKQRYENV